MSWPDKSRLREILFRASGLLKGLDGLLEIVGGVAAWAVSPALVVRVVGLLTQDGMRDDPHASYLYQRICAHSSGTDASGW